MPTLWYMYGRRGALQGVSSSSARGNEICERVSSSVGAWGALSGQMSRGLTAWGLRVLKKKTKQGSATDDSMRRSHKQNAYRETFVWDRMNRFAGGTIRFRVELDTTNVAPQSVNI